MPQKDIEARRKYNREWARNNRDKTRPRNTAWAKNNKDKKQLNNKVAWLKKAYGQAAKDYFLENPYCERCKENRIACLSLHHKEGKQVESFEILCHNCHAAEHWGNKTLEEIRGISLVVER